MLHKNKQKKYVVIFSIEYFAFLFYVHIFYNLISLSKV